MQRRGATTTNPASPVPKQAPAGAAGGNSHSPTAVAAAPPALDPPYWRQRRGYHYRNLAVFAFFGVIGITLIIVGATTIPADPPAPPNNAPSSTSISSVDGGPSSTNSAGISAERLRSDPNVFFELPLAREGACTAPETDARSWLRSTLNTMLSFGTRVAGSNSSGFRNVHHLITRLSACRDTDEAVATRRYWSVWHDNSTQDTVLGVKNFSNIIAEMNQPPRDANGARPASSYGPAGHLLVSAHFDSMLVSNFEFLAACDSASPVAMMLHMMRAISARARDRGIDSTRYDPSFPSYSFVFFDGEEAFVRWQGSDNTYGSRNLAARYAAAGDIAGISVFLLLDLLGPANPSLHNYFSEQTGHHYHRLRGIEQANIAGGRRRSAAAPTFFANEASFPSRIEDDHIPWLNRGVPILHMIPLPFPPNWHQAGDDGRNIDDNTAADLYDIFAQYALEFNRTAMDQRRASRRAASKQQQRR